LMSSSSRWQQVLWWPLNTAHHSTSCHLDEEDMRARFASVQADLSSPDGVGAGEIFATCGGLLARPPPDWPRRCIVTGQGRLMKYY
ncbi:hypothetical protein C1I97_37035, partial [Streptomyces sp. NTH33]